MRKNLERKTLLMFAVIALSLILLQAGSVSSADETIIYKGHIIRDDGSGNFEVAGKGGFNYSQFRHKAWDYVYLNVSNYIGVNKEVTLSTDAYVASLEMFNTTSQTWNMTNISVFNNGSLITRGFTLDLSTAQTTQFRVFISNTVKNDGTYSWFMNTSILDTMYVLEFDPIADGVNVAAQSKGSVAFNLTPFKGGALGSMGNANNENSVDNVQTGENNQNTTSFIINLSQPMAINKSIIISPTTSYEPTDYNISGNLNATGKFSDVELGNMTWTLLKSVVGGASSANITDDFVNNQSYNRYRLEVSKWNGGVISDANGWAINEWYLYNTSNVTQLATPSPPSVNVSISNSTSANSTASLASEQLFSNVNYSNANLSKQEFNSTFKWFINNTNQSWGGGNKTAELVPMIYKDAVGYWHLDENGGTNGYADSSGYGNTGFSSVGVSNVSGIIRGGVSFAGSRQHVNISRSPSLNLSGNMTLTAWIYPKGANTIIISNRGPADVNSGFDIQTTGAPAWSATISGTTLTSSDVRLNAWSHVAMTYNGSLISLYVNGILKSSTAKTGIGATSGANITFGNRPAIDQTSFNGVLDEVAVYNRSLTASEVKQLYLRTWYDYSPQLFLLHQNNETGFNTSDNEAPTTTSGVVWQPGRFVENLTVDANTSLYLRMDDGSGGTINDLTGNNNDALNFSGGWVNDSVSSFGTSFNGVNNHANVSHSSNINITNDITLEAWVRFENTANGPRIFEKGSAYALIYSTDTLVLFLAGLNPHQDTYYLWTPQLKRWYHIVGTYNNSHTAIFVDGVRVNLTSKTPGAFGASTNPIVIGGGSTASANFFNGTIDEVRILNRSLSAAEVLADYRRQAKAVRIAGVSGSYLNYSAVGNFNEREGTMEFWTKLHYDPVTVGSSPYYFSTGVSDDFSILQRLTTRTLSVFANDPGYFFHYGNNWLQDEWHHVAVTWNNYTSYVTLHVDGIMVNSSSTAFEIPSQSAIRIGSRDLGAASNCNCTISELRISRKALTAQEINLSFSKGRAYYQNEYLLNRSNYAKGDALRLEYMPKDSSGVSGSFTNSSVVYVTDSGIASEAEGDTAIELGINSSLSSAIKYSEQQVYVRNLSNSQTLGRFDWVAAFGSQRWLLNYITTGESYVRAPNLTTAVYVLEITNKASIEITDEVSRLINSTKA